MDGPQSRYAGIWRDERGLTLSELLTTILILGILIAIAVIVLFGILERRKVDAAARQLAGGDTGAVRSSDGARMDRFAGWSYPRSSDRDGRPTRRPERARVRVGGALTVVERERTHQLPF